MSKSILTIITILATTLTILVYTMFDSIEIKLLITLMDLPIALLIANELNNKH